MKKRLLSFFLALCMIFTLLPVSAHAERVFTGTCGDNITWRMVEDDNYDRTLTISGTGDMTEPLDINGNRVRTVIIDYGITSIGDEAFSAYFEDLETIIMPSSITKIGAGAFVSCKSLKEIILPDSVTSIGDHAFESCKSLTSIIIPYGVTRIGDGVFTDCKSLKTITIPESVTSIGYRAFDACQSLESIVIPESVTIIESRAFENCSSLEDIVIPSSVSEIDNYTFQGCTSLRRAVIPEGVTRIGQRAFLNCTSLESINIPNSVTTLGREVFGHCEKLVNINIPDSVTYICPGAFSYCSSLNKIDVDINNSIYCFEDDILLNKDKTTIVAYLGNAASYIIPDGITRIWDMAFYGCKKLKGVRIPDSVTLIGEEAFRECNGLKSIVIGARVSEIGFAAFSCCNELTNVYYPGSKDQWSQIEIDSNNYLLTNANIHYNSYGPDDSALMDLDTTDAAENDVVIASFGREIASGVSLDLPDCKLFKESGKKYKKLTGVTLARGGKTEENSSDNAYFVVPSAEVGDSSVKLSYKDYRDYIIPKDVMSSWSSSGDSISVTNSTAGYLHNAFMSLDKKDGKPYISTVFGCKKGGTYSEIRTAPLSVDTDDEFTIIVTAGGTGGKDCTYYLEQNANLKTQGSANGVFHENSLKGFKPGKKIYAYAKTSDGQVTEPIEVMLSIAKEPDLSPIMDFVDNSTFAFLGKDCFKITIPEDITLFGGAEISLEAFKFPAGVEIDEVENTIKISIGANIWEYARELKDTSPTKYRQWEKECFKDWKSIVKKSTYTKSVDTAKDAKEKYKKIKDGFYEKWYGKDKFGNYRKSDKSQTFSVDTLAYFEFEVVNGELKLKDACGTIEGKFKFDYTVQGSVWIIPAYTYIEASAGLAVSSKWARYICDSDIPLEYNFSININPEVKLGAGAGVKDAVSLGIYSDATLPLQLDFFAPQHFTLDCNGEIGAEGQLLSFKGKKKLLEGNLSLIDTYLGSSKKKTAAKKSPMLEQASKAAVELQVVSRDYLSSTSQWLGSGQNLSRKTRGVIRAEGMQLSTLQQSVFDNAQPQVVAFGDKLLMTWIQDASGRDDYNRMRLMYSVYDGSSWSEPAAVYDDGCNDNAPVLVSNGTDVFFAWQKLSRVLTTDDCDDIEKVVPLAEMYVAKYDASSNSITGVKRLTDDSVYDYSPCMTTENGNAVVYWASCDDNQMSTGSSNTIHKHVFGGNPTTVKSGLGYVIDMSACGSKLSFSTDIDGNTATTADIAVRTLENGKLTEFANPSDVNTVFTKCFYGKLNGQDTLFVSDMQNIYYVQDGNPHSVFSDSRSISGNINYVANGSDIYILWTELGDVGNVVYSSKYENGSWSEPIQVSKTGTYLSNIDATMYNGKISGVCMSELPKSNSTGSTDDSGRTDLCSFVVEEVQDVAVDSIHIEQKEIKKGQACEFTAYVTNNGSETVNNLKFTVSDDLGFSSVTEVSTEITSGATLPVNLSYTAPSNYGKTGLSVKVECSDIDDSNSENDSAYTEIGTPQITMTEGEISEFDDSYMITALVTNESDVAAENVQVSALLNSIENEPQCTEKISLGARETAVLQFTVMKSLVEFDETNIGNIFFSADDDSVNQYSLGVVVTDAKTTCEHSITENVDAVTATCTEKGQTAGTKCLGCGEIVSGCEETPVLGHNYGEWTVTTQPTCTEKGMEVRTCTRCSASETRDINALGHDIKHHAAKAATCTEKGWAAYDTCSRCNYSTYKEIAATGHHHNVVVTAPTCTAKGYTTHTCACGDSYKDSYTNALGHNYENGKCTRCGAADPNYNPAPAAPELKITTSAGKPKISWNAVDGAVKYWVYRSTDGKNFKYYDSTTKTSYTNKSTSIGTTYYYKVKAVNVVDGNNYASDFSVSKSIQCKPAAPTVSINRSNGKPKLSWKAVSGATKYWIYRSTDGVNFKYWDSTTKTSYTNSGAESGKKYYYRVKAVAVVNGKNIVSANSSTKSLFTSLAKPSVSITTSNGKPKLTWKAVTGADKYYIYRSTDGKNFSYWDSTTKTTYVNSGAKKNTKYYYKVKAVCASNSNANSAQSSTVSIKATK